jgi:hypothetical protein
LRMCRCSLIIFGIEPARKAVNPIIRAAFRIFLLHDARQC